MISAVDGRNLDKALSILRDESNAGSFDVGVLNRAIWGAAQFSSNSLMEALVARGADIDAVHDGKNVLYNAVSAQNEDGLHFLLDRKVNLDIGHLPSNALPLRAALRCRSERTMALLAKNGAPLDAEYQVSANLRFNILQEAVSQGQEAIARALLDNGASVDACSSTHGTALMVALSIGRESLAKLLIQRGADVNLAIPAIVSCSYRNPVEAAIIGRKPSLLKLLFQASAVTDIPHALRFAQAKSEYPLIPNLGNQWVSETEGARQFYQVMVMLAQRDLKYVCYFRKDDKEKAKREGMWKMTNDLLK